LHYEEVWVPSGPQLLEHLHSWWLPQPNNRIGTLIYFHGAGLNIGYNVTQVYWLRKLGFDVLLVEYRGYGLSEGNFPTERSFYEDAEAALAYLTQERGISTDEIMVYGHSLGGAIAIDLASKHPDLAGIIVQNSFTSMADMVARSGYARWFPVQMILHQRFESLQKVGQLQLPILLIHTTGDPMIPVQMSKRLYKAAQVPKQLILVKSNVHHNAGREFKTTEHLAKLKSFAVDALSAT
ncbi:MAG: alpha/beta hydrolase, partial [Leptolyngbya sp. SIO3F4]|nr:alpha/beta hydrolase [Leptolyngbya sp. SIO3F4]